MSNNQLQVKSDPKPTGTLKATHKNAIRAVALVLIWAGKMLLRVKSYEELEGWMNNTERRFEELDKQYPDFPQIEEQQKTDDTNLINNY